MRPWTTLLPLALLATACTPHLYSPPSRVAPLETARPVAPGETNLQASGGHQAETWGIRANHLAVKAGLGLTEGLDASLTANLTHVLGESAVNLHPNIYTARLGLRFAPRWLANYLAFTAGLGGGGSDAGGFFTADGGLNLAYENDVLVPFIATSIWVSQPAGTNRVDLTEAGDLPGLDIQIADTTWGISTSVGLMIPLRFATGDGPRGGLYLAITTTALKDSEASSVLIGVTPGIEVVF